VDEAGRYFDAVVKKIQEKDFRVATVPEHKVCKECDLRSYCFREGTIKLREAEL
jgi:CRISPR/Cas system-associated exonuclease Cas4 (RecB family)